MNVGKIILASEPLPGDKPIPPIWEPSNYYEKTRQVGRRNPRLAPRCDNCNRWIEGACLPDGRLPPPVPDHLRIFCNKDCGYSYMFRMEDERNRARTNAYRYGYAINGQKYYGGGDLPNRKGGRKWFLKMMKDDERYRKWCGFADLDLVGDHVLGGWEVPEEIK